MSGATPSGSHHRTWRYARALAIPLILWSVVMIGLGEPVRTWLRGEDGFDRSALEEWLLEARGFRETLPELVESYLAREELAKRLRHQPTPADAGEAAELLAERAQAQQGAAVKREEIHEHLKALGDPPTKMYAGQLPLFPIIYRLEVRLDDEPEQPIVWDSGMPSRFTGHQELELRWPRATVTARYQLHASSKRQRIEQEHSQRLRQLGILAAAATALGAIWVFAVQRRERDRERQRSLARQQLVETDELRIVAERELLEQRLATQAAERQALELKSQLYAGIGIMAGSYAHNIKNLLVRPNDLLRRCLESDAVSDDHAMMLNEVRQTLGTVTERLQEILRTVRRDPTRTRMETVDVAAILRDQERSWRDLARDKWKMEVALELPSERLPIAGDASHLQQAVENLVFNARDATFEMRNRLRDEARGADNLDANGRKKALIAAAAWKGQVVLRARRQENQAVVEVIDNGIGMSEEVRRRCTESFFSTKRDNALFEGHSTGMGLGLSFVVTILEHHGARLEIETAPRKGTTFRMRFVAAG